jgi:hypothetical protein
MPAFRRADRGSSGPFASAGLVLLALLVAGAMQAGAAPALVERAECVVNGVLPGGAGSCWTADRPRLHRVQAPASSANRPEVERELRRHEGWLNEYFAAAQGRHGGRHSRPLVTILAPPGGRGPGVARTRLRPDLEIEITVEDAGDQPEELAEAILGLAHLFAQVAQGDLEATGRPPAEARSRVLLADCMAGAYASWARRRGRIDDQTVTRIEEAIRGFPGASRYPDGRERLSWFQLGLRNGRTSDDPFGACRLTS